MENVSDITNMEEETSELPPGFRFHPTDLELIDYYLSNKVHDQYFRARAIGEVDLNSCEPWELRSRAKTEKEWYFFCVRDRKYPTGLRTNRATGKGYWKATGKDKEIYKEKTVVGMKKTLVFYKGRAPRGVKSNWVMHEYRLEEYNIPRAVRNEWVICRIFSKKAKRAYISGYETLNSPENQLKSQPTYSPPPPPLMDYSPENEFRPYDPRVSCFSTSMEDITQNVIQDGAFKFTSPCFQHRKLPLPSIPFPTSLPSTSHGFLGSQTPVMIPDPTFLYLLSRNQSLPFYKPVDDSDLSHGFGPTGDLAGFISHEQFQASQYGGDCL